MERDTSYSTPYVSQYNCCTHIGKIRLGSPNICSSTSTTLSYDRQQMVGVAAAALLATSLNGTMQYFNVPLTWSGYGVAVWDSTTMSVAAGTQYY